jgi:outer membrane protein TolC
MKGIARRVAIVLLCAVVFVGRSKLADAGAAVILEDCISQALRHSPQLEGLQHSTEAARDHIVKERSTTLPSLSSKLDGYVVNGSPVTPWSPFNVFEPGVTSAPTSRSFVTQNVHWSPLAMQSIDLVYPLFQYGSIMGLNDAPVVSSAKAALTKQQLASSLVEQKITLDVTTAFMSAVWYREKAELQKSMEELATRRLEGIQAQVAQGTKSPEQIETAKIDLEGIQNGTRATQESLGIALERLSNLTGGETGEGSVLNDTQPPSVPLPPLRQFLDNVVSSHPALRVEQAQVEIAHEHLRAVSADQLPTATLTTSFEAAEGLDYPNGGRTRRSPTAFLSYIEIKVPLFDFGGRRAATGESQESYLSEKARLKEVELDLRESIAQIYGEIEQIDELLAQARSSYLRAEQNLDAARTRSRESLTDEFAVISFQQARLSALLSLDSEQFFKRLKYAELQNLSGGALR